MTSADVKIALIDLCKRRYDGMFTDPQTEEWSEGDMMYYFAKCTEQSRFPRHSKKLVDAVARWGVQEAIRCQYIVPSPNADNKYFISEFILSKAK